MSILTIGRVGLDADQVEVNDWDQSGRTISVSGELWSTVADAKVLRQQLAGYVDNLDEPIVPVTWSEDSSVDGYYWVRSADVTTMPVSLVTGIFGFSVTLEQVDGFAGPLMETVITGAVRSNAHSITSSNAVAAIGVSDEVLEFNDSSNPVSSGKFTRSAEDGTVRIIKTNTYVRRQSFSIAPADWYLTSARIELGSPLRAVVGSQIPETMTDWRLSNGLVRVAITASGFTLSGWDGSAWSTAKVLQFTFSGTAISTYTIAGVRVLRNSPEECILRVSFDIPSALLTALGAGAVRGYADVALRRGDRMARFVLVTSRTLSTPGVKLQTTEAGTNLTGGLRATSNDADGHRYVLSTPVAHTTDTTNGAIAATGTIDEFPFAAGLEIDGSSAATNDVAQTIIYQYMAATSERVVIGSR